MGPRRDSEGEELTILSVARWHGTAVLSVVVGDLFSRKKVNRLALKENICGGLLIGEQAIGLRLLAR